jgi:hypothetical protein
VPDLGDTREDEHGDRGLRTPCKQVGDHHHVVTRQPVGPDTANEEEEDLRDETGGNDEAEVRRRSGQVKNRERERDRRERGTEQ